MKPLKTSIHIQDTFTISDGVAIVLSKSVEVDAKQIAEALRGLVHRSCFVDDAGCDWFYGKEECLVFIGGDRDWVASHDAMHVRLLETADLLDGQDYSAEGNGYKKKEDSHA